MSRGERFDVKIADIANRVLSINIPALLFTKIVLEENSRENCPIRPIKKKKKRKNATNLDYEGSRNFTRRERTRERLTRLYCRN